MGREEGMLLGTLLGRDEGREEGMLLGTLLGRDEGTVDEKEDDLDCENRLCVE